MDRRGRPHRKEILMGKAARPIVRRSLLSWVFDGNLGLQLLLLVVIAVVVVARVLPLEMQKRIVNQAIALRELELLLVYCALYLAAVLLASVCKYLINIIETIISQRALKKMRSALYDHILSLPLGFFRNTQPGTVVNSLAIELVPPSNFVGTAVSTPLANVLTLLAFAVYLFWLNPLLAAVSLSIYPAAMVAIPFLQRRANLANQKRVDLARRFAGRVAESMGGMHEIHGHGAYRLEMRKFDRLAEELRKIRIVWSLYRFAVKSTNNLFTGLGPFLIFLMGGYLAIKGQLELGALVAFLSAQEKLYDPWRELIDFYQVYQDGAVTYRRTMEFFDVEPDRMREPVDRAPLALEGRLEVKHLSFLTDTGVRLLDDVNLQLNPGEHLALVGFSGSGKSTLALCIGQLNACGEGQVMIGAHDVTRLSKQDLAANVGMVFQSPFMFEGSIAENLLYASEAVATNGGPAPRPSLDDIIAVLHHTGLFADVLRFGLNTVLRAGSHPELARALIRVRHKFQDRYGEKFRDAVEFFDDARYLFYSSVADNLVFGAATRETLSAAHIAQNDYFQKFLEREQLRPLLMDIGEHLARQTVGILGNLPPDAVFFEQSPIAAEELPRYKAILEHLRRRSRDLLAPEDGRRLLELALRFTPGVHKMAGMSEEVRAVLLDKRARFRAAVSRDIPGAFTFYAAGEFLHSQTILNNIIFGNLTTASAPTQERITQNIIQLLIERDLLETVIDIGMKYNIGSQGEKLSGGQRQKLAIARAFLKSPRMLIMDEATSALDNRSQARIQNLLETRWKRRSTLVAVVHRLDTIRNFDKIAVMKAGKIIESGSYSELIERKGALYELVGRK
jgi:ABC-type multidrug transport system fused ATPase/permease subunit